MKTTMRLSPHNDTVRLACTGTPVRLDAHGTYAVDAEELRRDDAAARKAGRWILFVLALFLATFAGLVGVAEWLS